LSDCHDLFFQNRHSGAMDGLELDIHGTAYPLPGGYAVLAHNLTKYKLIAHHQRHFRLLDACMDAGQ
jgi:hypothetical protein